jgi:hypothetical protein
MNKCWHEIEGNADLGTAHLLFVNQLWGKLLPYRIAVLAPQLTSNHVCGQNQPERRLACRSTQA